jgi:hypothetical protein
LRNALTNGTSRIAIICVCGNKCKVTRITRKQELEKVIVFFIITEMGVII